MRQRILILIVVLLSCTLRAEPSYQASTLTEAAIANALGWVPTNEGRCGGYYSEAPFPLIKTVSNKEVIQISSNEGLLFSQKGTSISQGRITITRGSQQITANKAYLYRDPSTGKLNSVDLISQVVLRQPNDLVIAHSAHYQLNTDAKLLRDIFYRTAIYADPSVKHAVLTPEELQEFRKVTQLSAWGKANAFEQNEPRKFELEQATYTTCPPESNAWQVRAEHIVLNQETGRGVAKNARVYVKNVPIIYAPYINFPIDDRRQTGFLWPQVGTKSTTGLILSAPFYWNMAPNYDMTIVPSIMGKRGIQTSDTFRYLSPKSSGKIYAAILPHDALFRDFKSQQVTSEQGSTDPTTIAELNRLKNASLNRSSFSWQDVTRYNDNWSSNVDYNYVNDDYYLRDLSSNLNEVTQNQLMQEGALNYKNPHWNFLSRIQGYQTLHPVNEPTVANQYIRLPQLALEGDYPDSLWGYNYFISNDLTRFDIRNMPGSINKLPIGDRLNIQPGISRSIHFPYFYVEPRLQYAVTRYQVTHVQNGYTKNPNRGLPIFDINTGFYFDRNLYLFGNEFQQTLEPEFYYTYVPYRNQNQIPVFDTTVNTLTYDQLFTYNRFSGLDRIGDANQLSVGVTTRFIDQTSGYEKVRAGVGQIFYFKNRLVTLCSDPSCSNIPLDQQNSITDYPSNPNNTSARSPIAGVLTYHFNPNWSANGDIIWNAKENQLNNETLTLHYQPVGTQKILNLGYSFVQQGDILPGDNPNSGASNLSQTDFSFSWPMLRDWSMVGRWTQNWNHKHFQNLLYGLQYDSCCWAVRMVAGRSFLGLNANNTYQYNTEFLVQFALKGLGNIGSSDPSQRLSSSISGYQSTFGRDF